MTSAAAPMAATAAAPAFVPETYTFKFTIKKWSEKAELIKSKPWGCDGWNWQLKIFPKGDHHKTCPRFASHLSVYLEPYAADPDLAGHGWQRNVRFSISIGSGTKLETNVNFELAGKKDWGWKKFAKLPLRASHFDEDGNGDDVTFELAITYLDPPESRRSPNADKQPGYSAPHFGAFLNDPTFADVVFVFPPGCGKRRPRAPRAAAGEAADRGSGCCCCSGGAPCAGDELAGLLDEEEGEEPEGAEEEEAASPPAAAPLAEVAERPSKRPRAEEAVAPSPPDASPATPPPAPAGPRGEPSPTQASAASPVHGPAGASTPAGHPTSQASPASSSSSPGAGAEIRPCVYAHKVVLSARSAYFQALFCSGLRESSMREIPVADCERGTFLDMMRFLYTGAAPDLARTKFVVFRVADRYGIEELRSKALAKIYASITPKSVLSVLRFATHYEGDDCRRLKEYALGYASKHPEPVCKSPEFARLLAEGGPIVGELFAALASRIRELQKDMSNRCDCDDVAE